MKIRGVASVLAFGAALLLGGSAFAQTAPAAGGGDANSAGEAAYAAQEASGAKTPFGSFNVKGLLRNETSFSTSNHDEFAGTNAGDLKNKRDINLLAMRAEANVYWRYSAQLTGYGKLRAWGDWANKVDDAYPNKLDVERGNAGRGFSNLAKSGNNWIVDIPQLYIDYRPGPFWVRVGKQQIAWAEALLLSTVDIIDGLDLRRHYFIDVLGEEVADERIGNNGIRFGIPLGKSGWEFEGFFTDFHPTIIMETCTQYSILPCAARHAPGNNPLPRIRDSRELHNVENNWDYGGRLHGALGSFELMGGFISKPSSAGLFYGTNTPGVFKREFPRENTAVWGMNYLFMSETGESPLDGLVARWDGGYTFNRKIASNRGFRRKDQISTAIQMEKQFRWSLSQPSMFAFAQPMWFRTQTGPYSGAYLGDKGRHHFMYSAVGFNQLIGNGALRYDFVTAHDWSGGELTQTGFLWKPSGRYQVDIYYTDFRGDNTSEFGNSTFAHMDELFFRLTRYF